MQVQVQTQLFTSHMYAAVIVSNGACQLFHSGIEILRQFS